SCDGPLSRAKAGTEPARGIVSCCVAHELRAEHRRTLDIVFPAILVCCPDHVVHTRDVTRCVDGTLHAALGDAIGGTRDTTNLQVPVLEAYGDVLPDLLPLGGSIGHVGHERIAEAGQALVHENAHVGLAEVVGGVVN